MSKLDSKPMQRAQHSMSSHDLGHVYDFTSSTGMILPLVCDVLNPGEKIDALIDLSETRTMPLDSAAYLNLDLHVDYFFVPMTLLMSKFESFITRVNDFYSNDGSSSFNLPLLDLDVLKSDILNNSFSKVSSGSEALDFDDVGKGSLRLLDHLGYGTLLNSSVTGWSSDDAYNPSVFPWALLAYNAAYEYYYINDEYEKYDNTLFNVDVVVRNNTTIENIYSYPYELCCLRYRNKYHDYFTRLKSSPIVSGKNLLDSAGALNLSKSWLSRDRFSVSPLGIPYDRVLVDGKIGNSANNTSSSPDYNDAVSTRTQFGFQTNFGNNTSIGSYPFPNGSDINTANLRALFANEKLWTITGMNRKRYDAQILAHFGYNVPTDVMHEVQHLGHHLYNLKVGEVISTSGTSTQPLATVAGKGYAFENKGNQDIKFTAPCHGVFIALYSSAIHRNYFGTFRKENAIGSWQDFYQPEFDNLGMQPMFVFEVKQDKFGQSGTWSYGDIIGWQYRYEQFKSRYDRSSFAFANSFYGPSNVIFSGPFASWGPSSEPLHSDLPPSMVFNPADRLNWLLKESPSELNNMMSIAYDPRFYDGSYGPPIDYVHNPWLAYATDPLVHHAYIKYNKLSTMSAYSLPKLND